MTGQFAAMGGIAFLAGIVQGVTGFGSGTVQMMILPWFFPLNQAAGIAGVVCCFFTAILFWRYRRHLRPRKVIAPIIIYAIGSYWAISFSARMDQDYMKRVMGVFLILLSVYFLFIQKKKIEHVSLPVAVVFSLVSGVCDGLFGIGGPLMVILFLAQSDSREEYLANSQTLFFVTLVINCVLRAINGIITPVHVPYMLTGIVMIWLGGIVAKRIADRLSAEKLRQVIYFCVGVAGVINLIGG